MNPAKMWSNLPKNGKIALIAGVTVITVYLWYSKRKSAAAAAVDTSATGTSTGDITDPNANDTSANDYGYQTGYTDAIDALGSNMDASIGAGGVGYNGAYGSFVPASTTGATSTTSGSQSSDADLISALASYNSSLFPQAPTSTGDLSPAPSDTTGGGAPSTGVQGAKTTAQAHTVTTPKPKATTTGGIVVGPQHDKPNGRAGYNIRGLGNGWWEYTPDVNVPSGDRLFPTRQSGRPPNQPGYTTVGLGNGWWAYKPVKQR